ncbi:MAG: hypothetical protein IKW15_07255, partial [Bacteroidales bacterium]|nr:hypothetical protein [Bacteroidales bacterium]
LASIGKESTPVPSPIPYFPLINLQYKTSTPINGTDLQITFESDSPIDTFKDYTLIGKLQITKPGYRPNTGKYRNYTPAITQSGNKTHFTFTLTDQEEDKCIISIHLKHFLIHTSTGHRTPEQYLAQIITPK